MNEKLRSWKGYFAATKLGSCNPVAFATLFITNMSRFFSPPPYLGEHLRQADPLASYRIKLLHDAFEHNDIFYLTLHQIYCLSYARPEKMEYLKDFCPTESMNHALQILRQLLLCNGRINPKNLEIFSYYPWRDAIPSEHLRVVGACLRTLSLRWASVTLTCQERASPPLVDELVENLHIPSTIFQRIAFTSIRRNMGYRDDKGGAALDSIFRQHQKYLLSAQEYTLDQYRLIQIKATVKSIIQPRIVDAERLNLATADHLNDGDVGKTPQSALIDRSPASPRLAHMDADLLTNVERLRKTASMNDLDALL